MASRESVAELLPETKSSVRSSGETVFTILAAISACHLLNDLIQATIPSLYPLFQRIFGLSLGQIGMITFTYQLTASLFQPFVGLATDKKAEPYSLALGMSFSLGGLLLMAWAPSYGWLLVAGSLVGLGLSVFHPESSRVARLASGGQHGLAQSLFQLAEIWAPRWDRCWCCGWCSSARGAHAGQHRIAWFSVAALVAIAILIAIGGWYKGHVHGALARNVWRCIHIAVVTRQADTGDGRADDAGLLEVFLSGQHHELLHLLSHAALSCDPARVEMYLFIFLGAVALGTILGGRSATAMGGGW